MSLACVLLSSCMDPEECVRTVLDVERANIPLRTQNLNGVDSITIDTMVITNHSKPYTGYLVTTWVMDKRTETTHEEFRNTGELYNIEKVRRRVYVKVDNIAMANFRQEWRSHWYEAFLEVKYDGK